MMLVGLTGGIGSGKTTVAAMFMDLGIPVFIADTEAKKLMVTSKVIRRKLIKLFGEKAYIDDELNRSFIASRIFDNKKLLDEMNKLIHPKVAKRFKKWVLKQEAPYVISEAAILFENDSYKNYDYIITVTAPKAEKIKRLLNRESSSVEKIKQIMDSQWNDVDKIKLSDYVIVNKDLEDTEGQVNAIHKKLIRKTKNQKL